MTPQRTGHTSTAAGGGLTTVGALLVLFVALKLCHVIAWPWLWVLAPAWISCGLVVVLLVAFGVAYVAAEFVDARQREARYRQRVGGIQPHEHGPARRWRR